MPRALRLCLFLVLAAAAPSAAQPLTLGAAVARALAAHPDLAAAAALQREAGHEAAAARDGWFPRVRFEEGWQRGNQPVFVFGSLLAQRQFTEANFAIASLNDPAALSNHRAALMISQPIFDGGRTAAASRAATAGATLAAEGLSHARADVALALIQAYGRALVADAAVRSAESAVASAQEDSSRAAARRDAGMATDADVLSIHVHLAAMRAREIAARADAEIARASLNRLMHLPIDAPVELAGPPPMVEMPAGSAAPDTSVRWEVREAAARVEMARANAAAARAPLVPAVHVRSGYEWNGGTWSRRAGSWVIGLEGQLSLSLGGAEVSTLRAARAALSAAEARRESAEAEVRLDMHTASARHHAARARLDVASAAVAQARESVRIIRDRFGAGMAPVGDILRAAQALVDAEALDVETRVEVMVAAAALERALGRVPGMKD